jgi:sortase (surface protein transpeptidase)
VFFRSLRSTLVALVVGLAIAGPATASPPMRLHIPRLGLDVPLARNLANGPRLYYRDRDTIAIAGHRTTHTRPFLHLPRLRRGDTIFLAARKYTVRRAVIVRPWQIWVLRYRGLVLSACHPAGSSGHRYVVFAAPTRSR